MTSALKNASAHNKEQNVGMNEGYHKIQNCV